MKLKEYKVFLNGKYLGNEFAPMEWSEKEILECIRYEELLSDEDTLKIKFIKGNK